MLHDAQLIVQVVIAGGSAEHCAQYSTPASNLSYLVDVSPGANHTPVMETMNFPRVVSAVACPFSYHSMCRCLMYICTYTYTDCILIQHVLSNHLQSSQSCPRYTLMWHVHTMLSILGCISQLCGVQSTLLTRMLNPAYVIVCADGGSGEFA